MKSDTTQEVRNQKKTGGGPEEKPAIYAELVFSIIGEHSEGVPGIDGRSQTQSCKRIRSIGIYLAGRILPLVCELRFCIRILSALFLHLYRITVCIICHVCI